MYVNWEHEDTELNIIIKGKTLKDIYYALNDHLCQLQANNARKDVTAPIEKIMAEINEIIHVAD